MNTKFVAQYLTVIATATATFGLYACDSGSTGGGGGSGGSGTTTGSPTTSGPGATTTSGDTSTSAGPTTSSSTGGGGQIDMIDNMEDMDGSILNSGGRKGAWFTFNDGTAGATQTPIVMMPFTMTMLPADASRAGSSYAANTLGSGFTVWGSGMGFDFNNDGKAKAAYDGSKYKGISFWARVGGTADLGGKSVRFIILDKNTAPEGGVCDNSAMPAMDKQCNDGFGAALTLTTSWQQFSFTWAQLTQEAWGLQVPSGVAAGGLFSVQFKAGAKVAFDTWIDDIGFME